MHLKYSLDLSTSGQLCEIFFVYFNYLPTTVKHNDYAFNTCLMAKYGYFVNIISCHFLSDVVDSQFETCIHVIHVLS